MHRFASSTIKKGANKRYASTIVTARSHFGGLFSWFTGKSSGPLPTLTLPLDGVTLAPPLPDHIDPPKTNITTLPNGVRIASQDSSHHGASIGLYIDCGSVYETPHTSGATHLLQKIAFMTTTNRSHLRIVREVEGIGGVMTASSLREQMSYSFLALKTYVPQMVEVLVDSVRNPVFLDWEVNEQVRRVKMELEELSSNPQDILLEGIHTAGYNGALANPLKAQESALDRINDSILEEFVASNYTAPRIVLAASGVEHEKLLEYAEPLLSDLPKVDHPGMPKSVYVGGEYRCQANSDSTHVALAFEVPGGRLKIEDAMTLTILQMLMGGGGSYATGSRGKGLYSRLYLLVLNEYPLLQSFSAFNTLYNHTGIFGISATTEPKSVPKAVEIMARELIAVATQGRVDQVDLDRAKASTKIALLMNRESRTGVADDIGGHLLTYGERKPVEHFLKIVDKVKLEDVTSFAQKMISTPLTMASWGNVTTVPSIDTVRSFFHAQ